MFATAVSNGGRFGRVAFTKSCSVKATVARVSVSPLKFQSFATTTKNDLVTTKLDIETGVAEISMHNGAVNSLSLEMLQALNAGIEEAESDPKIQALILQSDAKTTFSAGLDIMEMHQPEMGRLRSFWKAFQHLYLTLYGSRLACIAAIEGHAPAAGCMLALSCDYRIMAATDTSHSDVKQHWQPKIGLNETKLGIVAPPWLAQQMIDCVGVRHAELSLSLGTLYSPEEALRINLVDSVVPLSEVRANAAIEATKWGSIPPQARVASKMLIREPHLEKLKATADQDVEHFVAFVTNKKVQRNISAYLELLAKKRK